MRKAAPLGVLALGVALASVSSADVTIKIKETRDLGSKKTTVSTGSMCFNSDCLATRWDDADKQHGRVIFRSDKNLIWVVDDHKKSYQQIDKAFIDQMAAQMAAAKAQMQAQIEQLPPDQRAKAEDMMKKYSGDASSSFKLDYRKTAETRTINGYLCTKYDAYSSKDLNSHLWVAPYSALKLTPADGIVFEKMGEFVSKMTGAYGQAQKRDYIPMHELGGIPLLTEEVESGKVTSETLVESVTRGAGPPDSYNVPPSYKQEPMPTMEHRK